MAARPVSGWDNVSGVVGVDQDATWEAFLVGNPQALWGLVADVVKAVKAAEGEKRTGRRPAVAVGSLDELYKIIFPKRFDTGPFCIAFARALGSRSQRDFAEKIGVNQATVSRLVSGKTLPTTDHMERIAYALRVPPTYFAEYRAMKLGALVTSVLLANPELSVDPLRQMSGVRT